MSTNCAHASDRQNARHPRPPDPHPGISLSRLMLLKLQFLGRDAAGSNDHVQMANDYQILHLKPRARRLRNADNLMNAFAIVGTHLTHTRRLSVFIPGVLGLLQGPQLLILLCTPEGQRGHVPSSSEDARIYEGALYHPLLPEGWPESIYLLLIIRQITAVGQNPSNI